MGDRGHMGLRPIVAKFGGTSMGTAESIRQVAQILMSDGSPRGVRSEGRAGKNELSRFESVVSVVSATSGTTDLLIALGEKAVGSGGDGGWRELLNQLINRHEGIVRELEAGVDLGKFWDNLRRLLEGVEMIGELSLSARDRLLSFGERISAEILASYLNSMDIHGVAVDAFGLIHCDNNFGEGNVDFEKSYTSVREVLGGLLKKGVLPVVTGFIGQSAGGHYITLGRGGSDYTGAIVAAALEASELQIWTDVDGILSTDPRLVPGARVLPRLSFNEAGELAYFGAKVLHPKTIKPAIEKNIPVRILNTFNVEASGTLIVNEAEESLKSVTYKKGISVVNVCSAGMLLAHGFLARLFQIFEDYGVAVDVVSTSEVSVSLTVDCSLPERLLEDLRKFSSVTMQEGMAIVCLVGEGIRSNTKILGDLFSAIAEHDVSMVSQGASKRNITFLVSESEAPEVVRKVFNTFFHIL